MFQNQNTANNVVLGGGVTTGTNTVATSMDPSLQTQQTNLNYNGLQQQQQQQQSKTPTKKPYVNITEQPASKALRFRYECEGRSAGSIPGVNSTPENKTFPTIEIVGYKGRAVVVVSCVTKDPPYRPHPHNLVGKEGCKKGVCTLEINSETMRAVFSNLGIQCVKKKDIETALRAREEIRVDPFKTGFSHRFQPSSIDLNSVRLCFQVFMESAGQKGRFTQPLPPVVSEPIYDKKAMSDLVICQLCSCSASVLGNTQIILLCEKVAKEDIAVRFFEEDNGRVIWEAYGDFQPTDVHKQTAITFKTPKYRKLDITEPAKVFIQLRRPSDGVTSEPLQFEFRPLDSDPAYLKRKRQKTGGDPMHLLLQQQQKQHQNDHQDGLQANLTCWNAPNIPAIKTEPSDTSPPPFVAFGLYRTPPELTPSPQPLSPSNNYNHNTPSPYSMNAAVNVATANVGKPQLMSPNQYNTSARTAGTGDGNSGGGGGNLNTAAGSPMDIQDYSAFGQQQQHNQHPHHHAQQQQHHHLHHQQQQQTHHLQHQQHHHHQQQQLQHPTHAQQQQQFQGNSFASAGASHLELRFEVNTNVNNNNNNNLSNLSNTNPFIMQNLLTPANGIGGAGVGVGTGTGPSQHWNLAPNMHVYHQHHLQQEQQQQQQQHHQQQHQQQQHHHQQAYQQVGNNDATVAPAAVTNDINSSVGGGAGGGKNIGAASNNNNNNNNEHTGPTLSNLLSFDSEQLVRMNSADQQMLGGLSSEDLQISNLSIST